MEKKTDMDEKTSLTNEIVQPEMEDKALDIDNEFGKFKTAGDLLAAYNALESEFTRRSQKLAQMQRQSEKTAVEGEMTTNSDFETNNLQNSNYDQIDESKVNDEIASDVDENAQEQTENFDEKEWKTNVDNFFVKNPQAKQFSRQIAEQFVQDESLEQNQNGLDVAFARVLVENLKTPAQLVSDDEFLTEYVLKNADIKKKILKEYFNELSQNRTPNTINKVGVKSVTPPARPKTIEEAGWMFQKQNH